MTGVTTGYKGPRSDDSSTDAVTAEKLRKLCDSDDLEKREDQPLVLELSLSQAPIHIPVQGQGQGQVQVVPLPSATFGSTQSSPNVATNNNVVRELPSDGKEVRGCALLSIDSQVKVTCPEQPHTHETPAAVVTALSINDEHNDASPLPMADKHPPHTNDNPQHFWKLPSLLTFAIENVSFNQLPSIIPPNATIRRYFGLDMAYLDMDQGGRHFSPAMLEEYRHVGDPAVDDLLLALDKSGHPLKAGDDLIALAKTKVVPEPIQVNLDAFFDYYKQIPSWVDPDQLKRGQRVLLKYTPAIFMALYYRSLVAGFSIPKISKVIQSTAYLAPPSTPSDVTLRLIDTAALLAACFTEDLEAGGVGWTTALHVRILHAKVRRSLCQRTGKRAWDAATYGTPINQEDIGATLLAFSLSALVGVEFVGGITISQEETMDYLAVWRYIGWLLGVHCDGDSWTTSLRPLDPCGPGWDTSKPDSVAHARASLESIILHLVTPDESSCVIAHHLLNIGLPERNKHGQTVLSPRTNQDSVVAPPKPERKPPVKGFSFYFRALVCRRCIGDPLADALKLPFHSSWTQRVMLSILSLAYLYFLRFYTWAAILFPEWYIAWHRRILRGFHKDWSSLHLSRMARSLNVPSACPFAMVKESEQ